MEEQKWQGNVFKRILDKVSIWFAGFGAVAVFFMMLMMVADAVSRKFFGAVPGAYETSMALMVILVFLSQGYGQLRRVHVSVEIFTMRVPPKIRAILESFSAFLGVGVLGLLAWASSITAWECTLEREIWSAIVDYPVWPFRWFVPLGAGILSLQFLYTAIFGLTRFLEKER